jgi:hypothetical protein
MKKIILLYAFFCFISNALSAQCTLKVAIDTVKHPHCPGDNNGAIRLKTPNGLAPFTYNWIGNNGFFTTTKDINNLFSGKYSVTITDAAGCRDSILNIIVKQDTSFVTVTTTPTTNGLDGKATVIYTIGTESYTQIFTNLRFGDNRVYLIHPRGCARTFIVKITGITAINDLYTEGLEKFEIVQNSTNQATIFIKFKENKPFDLSVFTTTGQKIKHQSLSVQEVQVDLQNLPLDVLLFSLKVKEKIITKKMILLK